MGLGLGEASGELGDSETADPGGDPAGLSPESRPRSEGDHGSSSNGRRSTKDLGQEGGKLGNPQIEDVDANLDDERGWKKAGKRPNRGKHPVVAESSNSQYRAANNGINIEREKTWTREPVKVVQRNAQGRQRYGTVLAPAIVKGNGTQKAEPKTWAELCGGRGKIEAQNELYRVEPVVTEGIQMAAIQPSAVQEVSTYWSNTLVLVVVGKRPFYGRLLRYIYQVWKPTGRLELISKDNGCYYCRFENSDDCSRILEARTWAIDGNFILMRRWKEGIELERNLLATVPIWIRLPNLPTEVWHQDSLARIGSLVGNPIKMDEPTTQKVRLSFARLFIEIDATQILPSEVHILLPSGIVYKQPVIYESIPPRCSSCSTIGHILRDCPFRVSQQWRPVGRPDIHSKNREPQQHNEATDMEIVQPTEEITVLDKTYADKMTGNKVHTNMPTDISEATPQLTEQRSRDGAYTQHVQFGYKASVEGINSMQTEVGELVRADPGKACMPVEVASHQVEGKENAKTLQHSEEYVNVAAMVVGGKETGSMVLCTGDTRKDVLCTSDTRKDAEGKFMQIKWGNIDAEVENHSETIHNGLELVEANPQWLSQLDKDKRSSKLGSNKRPAELRPKRNGNKSLKRSILHH